MSRTLMTMTVLSLFLASMAHAQGYEKARNGIAWEPDYDKALAKAKELDRPVMVFFTMNGEPANETIHKNHLRRSEIIRASRKFICLVACRGPHGATEAAKEDGACCSRFGKITCRDHLRVEERARLELMDDPNVKCPQFVFLRPDGTEVMRHVWSLSVSQLLSKMESAYRQSRSGGESEAPRLDVAAAKRRAQGRQRNERRAAFAELAGCDDGAVVDAFADLTQKKVKIGQRLEAIMAMGQSKKEHFAPCLQRLLADTNPKVRTHAAVALEKIAAADSARPIAFALRRERNERARSSLLRALSACDEDSEITRQLVVTTLKRSSRTDRLTGLYVASTIDPDEKVVAAVGKLARNSNTQVRAAAYLVIGTHGLEKFRPLLEKRLRGERSLSRHACGWAAGELGGAEYMGGEDVELSIRELLPDNHLREGRLDAKRSQRKRGVR